MTAPLRFLFYSHDGLGLGHTRRNLAIASALGELVPDAAILLVTGSNEIHRLGLPPNVSVLKIPGIRKIANEHYEGRRLQVPEKDLWILRSSLLTTTVKSFRPDVILVDKHPLGASGELRRALELHRAKGGRSALGLRDVLDDPATVRTEWERFDLHNRIAEFYDSVFVYGQQNVFDSAAHYEFPPALTERTQFCGYVVHGDERLDEEDSDRPCLHDVPRDRPIVLATAGGGEDGYDLLRNFIEAAAGAPWLGLVVTGPMAYPAQQAELRRLSLAAGVRFCGFMNHLAQCLAEVDAIVCMGGYNTLLEAAASGTPTVCVPRVIPRTEQLIRARAFADRGLLSVIEPATLTPAVLRTQIDRALQSDRRQLAGRVREVLGFDGAGCAARALVKLARTAPVTS